MPDYPLPVFQFQVDWGGTKLAFSEASGLKVETEVIEYRDGLSKEFSVTKMPGIKKYGDITLKRGVFKGDNEYFSWWNTTQLNTVERRDITISLLDETHSPVMVWKVKRAWPSSIESPGMNSTGSEVAIESITIVNEGIVIENG